MLAFHGARGIMERLKTQQTMIHKGRRLELTKYGTGIFQNRSERGVVRRRIINMACKAHRCIQALEVKVILQ